MRTETIKKILTECGEEIGKAFKSSGIKSSDSMDLSKAQKFIKENCLGVVKKLKRLDVDEVHDKAFITAWLVLNPFMRHKKGE